jgi:L-seryl-tRNA(Ser) seleniumtransferase
VLAALRTEAQNGTLTREAVTDTALSARIERELSLQTALHLRRVVNGTGIVLHTNLGRSPLPPSVRTQLDEIAFGYSNLEMDLATGSRGTRYSHVEELLCTLTGAEAALVVNNNAAAVLLALSSTAAGREAIVSRGELVEIGGAFRIPDVMAQSGVQLREVGTTNRTHLKDYRLAMTEQTGLLLKVHCSNFAIVGFTAEVTATELVALGREAGIPTMVDAGSGNLVDLKRIGCDETTVQEYVRAGMDIVTFSGDKLLGGPQTGIIVGKRAFIDPMKKHPLLRALRVDKLTLAALEGTLRLYRDERQALTEIPTLRMLTETEKTLSARARALTGRLRRRLPKTISLAIVKGTSQAGGGSLPLLQLPTALLSVAVEGLSAQEIETRLRACPVPIIGRIQRDALLLDVRTILDEDLSYLVQGLQSLSNS